MLKKILIALGVVVALFVIIGVVAPKTYSIERSIVIAKPKDVVFAALKDMRTHNDWSPWAKMDPNIQMEFRGTDGTVGFTSAWKGNKEVGVGEQEIKNIVEGSRIDTELRFTEPMVDTSQTYFVTEAVDETHTKVLWGINGKTPFPINVFCFFMDMTGHIATEFDKGLNQLKTHLESK